MNFLFLTIFALFPASSIAGAVLCDQNCPQNEIYSRCAVTRQPNCWNRTISTTDVDCRPGCVCAPGLIRDPNTFLCVPFQSCPRPPKTSKGCPLNEVYSQCSAGCQRTCDTLNVAFKCKCVAGCICRDGYVRSQINGKCIPIQECNACPPGYKRNILTNLCEFCCQECPENEEFNECGTYCEADCFPKRTACIALCKRGCFCREGYVRGPATGECIPFERCRKSN